MTRATSRTGSSTSTRRGAVKTHWRPCPHRAFRHSATFATSCSSAMRNRSQGKVRGFGPPGSEDQNRQRIAQTAARLIVEHGISDWSHAKRKAARQLMLSEYQALPGDDE